LEVSVIGTIVRRCIVVALLVAGTATAAAAQRVNADGRGLAVKGYDVVAYFVDGRAVPGDARFEHAVDGVRYRFATAANRDRFAREPQRYLPQYGGFCAWAVSLGKTADTDPLAWRIVDGRLFLNYDRSVQKQWEGDIKGNVAKADANWPRLSGQR
jgi:YHS domain-containing protein